MIDRAQLEALFQRIELLEQAILSLGGEIPPFSKSAPVPSSDEMEQVVQRSEELLALEKHRQELAQADKLIALGTLVSTISHEINNPNHTITLTLPLLQKTFAEITPLLDKHAMQDPDFSIRNIPYREMRYEIPAMIQQASQSAARIQQIISELQAFARTEVNTTMVPIHVNEVMQATLNLVQGKLRKSTHALHVEYGDSLPLVYGNFRKLEQILMHLLLNAAESLADPSKSLQVRTLQREENVVIEVVDQGRGISPENLPHILDPFFSTKRTHQGAGLGLAISSRLAKEHGGKLLFDSTPQRGTKVELVLPVFHTESFA